MSSSINRRRDVNSPRVGGNVGPSSKLRMDRQPMVTRISDPSLAAGKRKEIDNVMKKARASSSDYWDKKLLEVEEKDPNRWRHTGYKKLYIEGDSSSESEREGGFRYNNTRVRASRSPRNRRTPPHPQSPVRRQRSPDTRRRSPKSPDLKRRIPRSPEMRRRSPRSPDMRRRPRSPIDTLIRRKSPRSPRSPPRSPPHDIRRRSPQIMMVPKQRPTVLPRSKRPPSPPPKRDVLPRITEIQQSKQVARSPSKSSLSSCSDDSCSVCSPKHRRARSRSRSVSLPRSRPMPRSPQMASKSSSGSGHHRGVPSNSSHLPPSTSVHTKPSRSLPGMGGGSSLQQQQSHHHHHHPNSSSALSGGAGRVNVRPISPPMMRGSDDKHRAPLPKYRAEEKAMHLVEKIPRNMERPSTRHIPLENIATQDPSGKHSKRISKNKIVPEDPRLKVRPPEPPEPAPIPRKHKEKSADKLRAKVKIEGEKRKKRRSSSSGSDDSSSSENSLPTFTATTRLTLSERFGKMAQWSVDRSNMENMRITKDSAGGALKVMIEEGLESPPNRSYSPAPPGHFPEELSMTAPSGLMSWDDVRVRYDYYKSRGYLRDLDLQDYIKWEEWWYRYQEWLKQERYYEFWERQQNMRGRRRKKIPITQRLN